MLLKCLTFVGFLALVDGASVAVASAQTLGACPIREASMQQTMRFAANFMADRERNQPPGTRVYYVAWFNVDTGNGRDNGNFTGFATFRCDAFGLHIDDKGRRVTFPHFNSITRFYDQGETWVEPGEKMPPELIRELQAGVARYAKTL